MRAQRRGGSRNLSGREESCGKCCLTPPPKHQERGRALATVGMQGGARELQRPASFEPKNKQSEGWSVGEAANVVRRLPQSTRSGAEHWRQSGCKGELESCSGQRVLSRNGLAVRLLVCGAKGSSTPQSRHPTTAAGLASKGACGARPRHGLGEGSNATRPKKSLANPIPARGLQLQRRSHARCVVEHPQERGGRKQRAAPSDRPFSPHHCFASPSLHAALPPGACSCRRTSNSSRRTDSSRRRVLHQIGVVVGVN